MSNDTCAKILELIISGYKQYGEATIFQHKIDALNDAIKALNKHESLVSEVERLKQENEQLREALKKCSPNNAGICRLCGAYLVSHNGLTTFMPKHKADCRYILLTGGDT